MKRAPKWTDEELIILERAYETGGLKAAHDALHAAGHPRTRSAIKTRVGLAGFRYPSNTWEPRELAILHRYYPATGPNGVKAALAAKGYYRTSEAILTRAARERVRYDPPKTPPPPRKPRDRSTRHRTIAGQRLTTTQLALIAATPDPDDGLLDPDEQPLGMRPESVRQIAKALTKRKLLHHYSRGLYHLTLGGLAVKRTLEAKRAA